MKSGSPIGWRDKYCDFIGSARSCEVLEGRLGVGDSTLNGSSCLSTVINLLLFIQCCCLSECLFLEFHDDCYIFID